jgi:hypothetical protein
MMVIRATGPEGTTDGSDCVEEVAAYYKRRINKLEQQLAALSWKKITPENLPKEGPYETGSWFGTTCVFDVAHCVGTASCEELLRNGWTHFRPINPPEAEHDPR